VERVETDLKKVAAYRDQWDVTWISVDGLGDADVIMELGQIFNLHGLALEDVVNVHQRPKTEDYVDHFFLVMRVLEPGLPLRTEQISIFFGPGYVISLQEDSGDCLDIVRNRIRDGRGRIRGLGADYLVYCLFDAVLDAFFPALEELSDRIEALEAEVVTRPTKATVSRIQSIKRDLLAIRRVVTSSREAVNVLIRDTGGPIAESTRPYLRDAYDHTVQILDTVETFREIVGSLLDVYLSSVSNRMNEIMKVLTMMATLFIPLSFLAGVYGMNFSTEESPWNMPELHWRFGYPLFLCLIVAVAIGELIFFWRRGWLSSDKGRPAEDPPEDGGQESGGDAE
jgi:magnesium transporter